jgi:hypothetical protein
LPTNQSEGTVSIKVKNVDNQEATKDSAYTFYAAPRVTSVTPSNGKTTGGTSITITGEYFRASASVLIGMVVCNVSAVTSTSITCTTNVGSAGSYAIKVTNTDGQFGESASPIFTYRAEPSLTSVSPDSGPLAGGTLLTLTGTNFYTGDKILLGDSNGYFECNNQQRVSATTMTCLTPGPKAAGAYNVRVQSTDTTSTIFNQFTYRAAPTISTVSPDSGKQAGGTSITVTGTNFAADTVVKVGGKVCTYVSHTVVAYICTTPQNPAGMAVVSVVNSDAQSASLVNGFNYTEIPVLEFQVGVSSPNPPNPDNYGPTTTNITHTFTLKNTGEGSSSVISVTITGSNSAAWLKGTDNCEAESLAPGESCTIQVTFLGGFLSSGIYSATLSAAATSGGITTNTLEGEVP